MQEAEPSGRRCLCFLMAPAPDLTDMELFPGFMMILDDVDVLYIHVFIHVRV